MRTGDGVFGPEDSGEDVVRRRHLAGCGHEAERRSAYKEAGGTSEARARSGYRSVRIGRLPGRLR